jgi:hypothetical protein
MELILISTSLILLPVMLVSSLMLHRLMIRDSSETTAELVDNIREYTVNYETAMEINKEALAVKGPISKQVILENLNSLDELLIILNVINDQTLTEAPDGGALPPSVGLYMILIGLSALALFSIEIYRLTKLY